MGYLDQLAKQTFAAETHIITSNDVSWSDPPEIPVAELRADGYLRVDKHDALHRLPWPWQAAKSVHEILLELKMAGDHLDILELERAVLRRQARQVQRLAKADAVNPVTSDTALWFVAPNLPSWLNQRRSPQRVAPGCYTVEPSWFQLLWVAANELPLLDELIPFLTARSGRALDEFVRWVAPRRSFDWMSAVLEYFPMSEVVYDELFAQVAKAQKNPVHEARRQRLLRAMLDDAPEVRSEVEQKGVDKGLEKGLAPLVHLVERKLRRTLTAQDRQTLAKRIDLVGPERVGDVVLESTSEQLAAWLENVDAR